MGEYEIHIRLYRTNARKSQRRVLEVYNYWDFYVALNMVMSDNYCMFKDWFPGDNSLDDKIIEMTINYFNDKDAPYPDTKIWCYFNR